MAQFLAQFLYALTLPNSNYPIFKIISLSESGKKIQ